MSGGGRLVALAEAVGLRRPLFDHLKRLMGFTLSGLAVLYFYGLSKLAGPPSLLPLTTLDLAIPLLPWTVWIYGSGTKAALLGWMLVPDARAGRRLFWTLALCAAATSLAFTFWPTTYPRDLYPLPVGTNASLVELADLRDTDSPTNCFPSLHVALAWGLALNWAGWSRPRGAPTQVSRALAALPILWAAAVSVCTLTTKQHYVVDVPAGMLVGLGAFLLARRAVAGPPLAADGRLHLEDPRAVEALLARVRAHQWRLADVPWPDTLPPLPPLLARLLNEVIYVEEIARLNFELLRDASDTPALREIYDLFATEERRHADGLRLLLARSGAALQAPGLGNSLVLDQFDELSPDVDAALVAVSTPVFETFLDAGTIPFLRAHPALCSPAFDAFVDRVCADEAAHLALNWIVVRDLARRYTGARGAWASLRLLTNPNILRGMGAVPWMSLEVYAVAHRLGYDFATLLPPFGRLWRLHERFPELARFSLWWPYRLFVVVGWVATITCMALARTGLLFAGVWVLVTRVTGLVARVLFGDALLRRRGLPPLPARALPVRPG
ncbi:MAG: phosphatase PAP2 family protein [Pseudomonadota bacterium]|nr:phosphatase PAP2 family protein [Pseudomonadota bacterium]